MSNPILLHDLLAELASHAGERTVRPASEDAIANAEKVVQRPFPDSYKWFLRNVGYTSWPEMIYGVGDDLRPGQTIVRATQREESLAEPPLQAHLVPISPDGWGNHFCLDTSQIHDGDCPVVFWDHEAGADQTPPVVASGFYSWLLDLVTESLQEEAAER